MVVHKYFNVELYLDFLKEQKLRTEILQADAVSHGYYVEAIEYKTDASMLAWVIQDLEECALTGKHL